MDKQNARSFTQERLLRYLFALVCLGCLWGGIATYDRGSVDAIRVVANASPQDEDYHGAHAFKKYVEENSGGDLRVKIYPFGEFCATARECIAFLRQGMIDVFMTTGGGVADIFAPAQVIDVPYLFPDEAAAECVFDGDFTDDLRREVLALDSGMRLMVIGNTGGWRSFATIKEPIKQPRDLRGVKIRTTTSEMHQALMREFGASPTPISWSELYVSLATGVVDGTTNSLPDIINANLHEQIRHITLDNHSYMGAIWWFSEVNWRRMETPARQIVTGGFEQLKEVTRDTARANEARATEVFTRSGGTIIGLSAEERAGFEATAYGIRDWFSAAYGDKWLQRISAAVAACGNG